MSQGSGCARRGASVKVFGRTNPRRYDCPEKDGSRAAREVVAAKNRAQAQELFGGGRGALDDKAVVETRDSIEIERAMSAPGKIFWRPLGAPSFRYVRAGETWDKSRPVWIEPPGAYGADQVAGEHGVVLSVSWSSTTGVGLMGTVDLAHVPRTNTTTTTSGHGDMGPTKQATIALAKRMVEAEIARLKLALAWLERAADR